MKVFVRGLCFLLGSVFWGNFITACDLTTTTGIQKLFSLLPHTSKVEAKQAFDKLVSGIQHCKENIFVDIDEGIDVIAEVFDLCVIKNLKSVDGVIQHPALGAVIQSEIDFFMYLLEQRFSKSGDDFVHSILSSVSTVLVKELEILGMALDVYKLQLEEEDYLFSSASQSLSDIISYVLTLSDEQDIADESLINSGGQNIRCATPPMIPFFYGN